VTATTRAYEAPADLRAVYRGVSFRQDARTVSHTKG